MDLCPSDFEFSCLENAVTNFSDSNALNFENLSDSNALNFENLSNSNALNFENLLDSNALNFENFPDASNANPCVALGSTLASALTFDTARSELNPQYSAPDKIFPNEYCEFINDGTAPMPTSHTETLNQSLSEFNGFDEILKAFCRASHDLSGSENGQSTILSPLNHSLNGPKHQLDSSEHPIHPPIDLSLNVTDSHSDFPVYLSEFPPNVTFDSPTSSKIHNLATELHLTPILRAEAPENSTLPQSDARTVELTTLQSKYDESKDSFKTSTLSDTLVTSAPSCAQSISEEGSLNFVTESTGDFLVAEYASKILIALMKYDEFSAKEQKQMIENGKQIIHSTVSSLPPFLMPYYYSVELVQDIHYLKYSFRIIFYFLFTSISYLQESEACSNSDLLKALVKAAYVQILRANHLKSGEWAFLNNYLQHLLKDHNLPKIVQSKSEKRPYFDISTLSFIYNEMKFGKTEEIKKLFSGVWKTHLKERQCVCAKIQITHDRRLIVPRDGIKRKDVLEHVARKLYQIKFTEMIFNEWDSMEELLAEYSNLVADFGSISLDFRCRSFNRKDFELLKRALERIICLSENYPDKSASIFDSFFCELSFFIHLKSLVFMSELWKEYKKDPKIGNFLETFENIKAIAFDHDAFIKPLSQLSLKRIVEKSFNFIIDNSFTLEFLANNFLSAINSQSVGSGKILPEHFGKFFQFLNESNYFEDNFENLTTNLSRFWFSECAAMLDEILAASSDECHTVLRNPEYRALRDLWKTTVAEIVKLPLECKKSFLQHLKTFLILYIQ